MMKTSQFSFSLPESLIAQYPTDSRGESRLMLLDRNSGKLGHYFIKDVPALLPRDSLLVFNNSKVRKARLYGLSETGGRVEFLLLKPLNEENTRWLSMVSKSKKQVVGKRYVFSDGLSAFIEGLEGSNRVVCFSRAVNDAWLDKNGSMPLPPYIKREDELFDADRYQTVYSKKCGSVAAPTAGLHFTKDILEEIALRGIDSAFLSLHVGLGTFLPVRTQNVEDHRMHTEEYEISNEASVLINSAIKDKRPVVAVGTTSVRCLESEALRLQEPRVEAGKRSTDIFIYPGRGFSIVDHLITNFHTPESSLLMLVSAFAGKQNIDAAYREAIERKYRFFSYGDAMLIL